MKPRDKAEAALNHEAMARDNAAAALRKRAEAAMKLERQGRHNDAIARVDDLAAKHSDSALVLHLAGHIHHAAARRAARAGDKESMANHIVTAHGHIDRAKRLVPNCIAISDLLARVLFLGLRHAEAERVARDAVSIASPVDPADNSALYAVRSNATRHRRVEDCRKAALDNLRTIERYFPDLVRKVLKLDANGNAQEALKKAKDLANSFPSSSRLQLLSAHMQLRRLRSLDPGMDRRPFLDHIRKGIEDAIAKSSGGSLVLALFHAKVCFVLGLYKTFSFECVRAFAMREPVDPKLEDVPPDSVQGDEFQDRVHSVHAELKCLLEKLFLVADDFRRSMASEKQDDFLSVRLVELQEYYDANFRNYKWDAQTTIADALSFVKNNRSWRFWVCPSCAGNELLADVHTLLEHMNSKHLPGLLSVFDDSQRSAEYVLLDGHLDQISVYQDSEGGHFFRFNKTESVFKILSLPSEELSFSALKEEKCIPGKEILEEIEDKLKLLPADKSNAEFDEARLKVLDLWLEFVKISMLDYRLIIMAFAKPFIWTELLQSLSEHKAASKISNDDIDVIFPCGEVHAEDKMGRSEIQPNSNIADDQSGVNSASNLLGSSSQPSEQTTRISIYRKSIEVLNEGTNDIFIFNFIIQMLWNLRCFRDEFLKRRPVCTLPSHEGPCISQMLYAIFTAWEKDDHHITDSLISIRDTIRQVLDDSTVGQNVEVNTSSYIVTTIINGLKMLEVLQEMHFVNFPCDTKVFETLRQVANPAKELCNKEIISREVKSFADNECRQVDQLPVSMSEFFTLAMHIIPSEEENQLNLLEEILSDPDSVFIRFRNLTHKIECNFVSLIFCHEGKLAGIVRDQNKWLVFVYNEAEAIEFDSLEALVDRYGSYLHEIHPGVCFFNNVKFIR